MTKERFLSKGANSFLSRTEAIDLFTNFLDTKLYQEIKPKPNNFKPDLSFRSNEDFWEQVFLKRIDESQIVSLTNFHVLEWLPSSPGRFFTPKAKTNRENALNYVARYQHSIFQGYEQYAGDSKYKDKIPLELAPMGKENMILGGVGSLRLSAKIVNTKRTFFLGASSSGISHEGIPLIVEEDVFKEINKLLKENHGLICDITGTLSILPIEFSLIKFDREIPRYCFYVKDFKFKRKSKINDVLSSIAISFSKYRNDVNLQLFSFCSFNPDPYDKNLKIAVEWLGEYSRRYAQSDNLFITGDFDEQYSHFQNVDFKLSDFLSGKIPIDILKTYGTFLNLNINELVLGDKFQNISDSTIINKSQIRSENV